MSFLPPLRVRQRPLWISPGELVNGPTDSHEVTTKNSTPCCTSLRLRIESEEGRKASEERTKQSLPVNPLQVLSCLINFRGTSMQGPLTMSTLTPNDYVLLGFVGFWGSWVWA